MGLSMESQNNPVARNAFLRWINDYKELLSVIIFFIGGFLWVYGVFATKAEIKELKCLINVNIDAIYSQIDESNLSQLLVENLQEQDKLKHLSPSNDVDQRRLAQLAAAALDIQSKLQRATNLRAESSQKLRSDRCSE